MHRRAVVGVAAWLVATAAGAADVFVVDPIHSEAGFRVRHLVTRVHGHFADFEGEVRLDLDAPERSAVEFRIRVASIDTGHAERDEHLRSADFFDAERYPEISFTSGKIERLDENRFAVTGTFRMHGVTKEVTLPVTYLGRVHDPSGDERAGFEVRWTLNRKDYGIVWNRALDSGGYILGDEVEIEIDLEVRRKAVAKRS